MVLLSPGWVSSPHFFFISLNSLVLNLCSLILLGDRSEWPKIQQKHGQRREAHVGCGWTKRGVEKRGQCTGTANGQWGRSGPWRSGGQQWHQPVLASLRRCRPLKLAAMTYFSLKSSSKQQSSFFEIFNWKIGKETQKKTKDTVQAELILATL